MALEVMRRAASATGGGGAGGALDPQMIDPPSTLAEALAITREARVVTSALKPYRILHTNAAFTELTGFKSSEAMGKTCAILQGPETEADALHLLESAIASAQPTNLRLTNYTSTGQPFTNLLEIHPLYNRAGVVTHFSATLKAVPISDGSVAPVPANIHKEVIAAAAAWVELRLLHVSDEAEGAAAAHAPESREEAARQIIGNHRNVLRDVTNPSSAKNIHGKPLTQRELRRLPPADAPHVDQFLRELSRRLLGTPGSGSDTEELVDASVPRQAAAWSAAATYLDRRIHTVSSVECPPSAQLGGKALGGASSLRRTPDMSPEAAAAMRAVMAEMARDAAAWAALHAVLETRGATHADGSTGSKGEPLLTKALRHLMVLCHIDTSAVEQQEQARRLLHGAREEAARALLSNHARVLRDVTNPSRTLNIDRQLLTQQHLQRVPIADRRRVDRFLRHVVRRLLSHRDAPALEEEAYDGTIDARQAAAWAGAATYLSGRIQTRAAQKSGRAPDMSESAAAALRAVLREVAAEQPKAAVAEAPAAAAAAAWPVETRRLDRNRRVRQRIGSYELCEAFNNEAEAIVMTEASPPHRITHVNQVWVDMCGYEMEEVEGRTNAVLQGPETDVDVVRGLMACVSGQEPVGATVVNYKKSGERFINQVQIEPVYDDGGQLAQYMAILTEVDPFDLRRLLE